MYSIWSAFLKLYDDFALRSQLLSLPFTLIINFCDNELNTIFPLFSGNCAERFVKQHFYSCEFRRSILLTYRKKLHKLISTSLSPISQIERVTRSGNNVRNISQKQ